MRTDAGIGLLLAAAPLCVQARTLVAWTFDTAGTARAGDSQITSTSYVCSKVRCAVAPWTGTPLCAVRQFRMSATPRQGIVSTHDTGSGGHTDWLAWTGPEPTSTLSRAHHRLWVSIDMAVDKGDSGTVSWALETTHRAISRQTHQK